MNKCPCGGKAEIVGSNQERLIVRCIKCRAFGSMPILLTAIIWENKTNKSSDN